MASAESLDLTSGTTHPNKFATSDGKLTTTIGFDNYASNDATVIGTGNRATTSSVWDSENNVAIVVGGTAVGKLNQALVGALPSVIITIVIQNLP